MIKNQSANTDSKNKLDYYIILLANIQELFQITGQTTDSLFPLKWF